MSAERHILIQENPSRICGAIVNDTDEYGRSFLEVYSIAFLVISGTVDDLCLRDFIVCTLHHLGTKTFVRNRFLVRHFSLEFLLDCILRN